MKNISINLKVKNSKFKLYSTASEKIDVRELKKKYKINESLAKLDEDLIGLDSVKNRISEITAILFKFIVFFYIESLFFTTFNNFFSKQFYRIFN